MNTVQDVIDWLSSLPCVDHAVQADAYRAVRALQRVVVLPYGHCLSRHCLRGSSVGDRVTALRHPIGFRPGGCECMCGWCLEAFATARALDARS